MIRRQKRLRPIKAHHRSVQGVVIGSNARPVRLDHVKVPIAARVVVDHVP